MAVAHGWVQTATQRWGAVTVRLFQDSEPDGTGRHDQKPSHQGQATGNP